MYVISVGIIPYLHTKSQYGHLSNADLMSNSNSYDVIKTRNLGVPMASQQDCQVHPVIDHHIPSSKMSFKPPILRVQATNKLYAT